jgi:hypothetical protein
VKLRCQRGLQFTRFVVGQLQPHHVVQVNNARVGDEWPAARSGYRRDIPAE